MSRYDFIKFGGSVQWYDDTSGSYHTMKVCYPVPLPVNEDTEISLIPAKDKECEVICIPSSVKASGLVPCPSSFDEGFWKALTEARKNGASDDVLLAVLRSSGMGVAECIHLMYGSNHYGLYPVLCRLFPETEEIFRIITWKGKDYPARRLTIFKGTPEELEILVSVESLLRELIDGNTGVPVSDEAEEVDGQIYYYLADEEITLPDGRIVTITENT